MSPGAPGERHAAARAAEEETRYRAVAELDGAVADDRALLLELLADPSWRVRTATVERIAGIPDPGPMLAGLVEALASGPTIGARDAAASALARIGAPAVAPLLERLGGADPDGRQAAASVLGELGDRQAAVALAARLADEDVNVRAASAEALGKIGGPAAAGPLLAAVESDDPTLRLTALEALGAIGVSPPAARVAVLLGDRSLRRPAYRALGASDEPEAFPLLARGLAEPARGAREAALAAVGKQRARRPDGLEPLAAEVAATARRDGSVPDAVAGSLGSDEPWVAMGALTVLGWVGAPRHVAAMLRVAEDDRLRPLVEEALERQLPVAELRAALAEALGEQGPLGRITALAALARLGSPAALESVVREASDPEAHVQAEAISALGRLGDSRGVAPLAGLLGDDTAAAGIAANALIRIGQRSPEGEALVLGAVRDRAQASSSGALFRLLGSLGTAADLATVRAGLASPVQAQRVAAAAAVGALAQRGVVRGLHLPELLAALVDDPSWGVRAAAARAYVSLASGNQGARHGEPRLGEHPISAGAISGLLRALGDPEPAVRAAAVEALGACRRPELTAAVEGALRDPQAPAQVIVAALRALSAHGAPPAEAVTRAAGHADPEVVKEAVAAAARLPGAGGEAVLAAAARSPRWDVRRAAARALVARADPRLGDEAARLAAVEPDPLVARAFADAARALGGR